MSLSIYLCDCVGKHKPTCPSSTLLLDVITDLHFNPWQPFDIDDKLPRRWHCAYHGKCGDINTTAHQQVCGNHGWRIHYA